MRHPLLAAASLAWSMFFPFAASAQAPLAALTGTVSSADEATMEGVLVSATKAGSNITVTVVTGADGRYSFPANRLGPGQYTLAIRAVGYEARSSRKQDRTHGHRSPGSESGNEGYQARQDQRPRRPIVERGMARKRPRHRSAEGPIAQLRRLPPRRTHHALEIRFRTTSSPRSCRACRAMCSKACRSIRNCAPPSA